MAASCRRSWRASSVILASTEDCTLIKAAGLPRFRFHDLRHSAAAISISLELITGKCRLPGTPLERWNQEYFLRLNVTVTG